MLTIGQSNKRRPSIGPSIENPELGVACVVIHALDEPSASQDEDVEAVNGGAVLHPTNEVVKLTGCSYGSINYVLDSFKEFHSTSMTYLV